VLYALLRYGTLVEKISVMFLASWYMTPRGCNIVVRFQVFPMILRSLAYGMFSALRVYVLRGNDWRLASVVFLLCFPSIITPAYGYTHQWSPAVDRYGCQLAYLASQTIHERMRIAGIAADITSEVIVIVVTFMRTFSIRNNLSNVDMNGPSISNLLLKGGVVHFFALLILSLADMLVLVLDHVPEAVIGYDYWVVPYYTPVFRTIIICRFLLALRDIHYQDIEDEHGGNPVGSMQFRSRIVGSMGATLGTLNFGNSEPDDEEEAETIYSNDPFTAGMMAAEALSGSKHIDEEKEGEIEALEVSQKKGLSDAQA